MRIRLERDGHPVEQRTLTLFVGLNALQLEQMGWDGTVVEEGKLAAIILKPVSSTRLLWLCYSLVNVSFPVEVWRQARVPDSGAASIDLVVEPRI